MNSDLVLFAFTDADGWHFGIGDPTFMGWFTVFAYFATAFLTWRVARRCDAIGEVKLRAFWRIITTILVLLGINKQLDLQTLLTLTVRKIALAQGWYERRRVAQALFIFLIALGAVVGLFIISRLVRSRSHQLRLPLTGLALLLAFVVVRAASFHHIDQFLHFRFIGMKMNWLLELGGIGVVALGALKNAPRAKPRRGVMRPRMA